MRDMPLRHAGASILFWLGAVCAGPFAGAPAAAAQPQAAGDIAAEDKAPENGFQWDSAPSRRVSTCGFIVSFSRNSDQLDDDARKVIAEAAQEIKRKASRSTFVESARKRGEQPTLHTARRATVMRELKRLDTPDDQISEGGNIRARMANASMAYVDVCGGPDQTLAIAPGDRNRPIEFVIGGRHVNVPLRYLGPRLWRDTPLEPVHDTAWLRLVWPGFRNETSDIIQRCANEKADDRVECRRIVLANLGGAWAPPAFDNPSCCATDGTSLYLKLPRVAGIRLFAPKYGPRGSEFSLMGTLDDGEDVQGRCWLKEMCIPAKALRSSRQIEASLALAGRCSLDGVSVADGLAETVTFNGSLLPHWKEIFATVHRARTPEGAADRH